MKDLDVNHDARVDDARAWLGEFFAELGEDGTIRLALARGEEWDELQPFRIGWPPFTQTNYAGVLDVLAGAVVTAGEVYDVYACPYPHARHHRRRLGAATMRSHVHADVDGQVDLAAVRQLGAMAVASGSVTDDGRPHGHVYVRLIGDVSPEEHRALCLGLGARVGGEHHDAGKVGDADVLRPAGTLNHKSAPARSVKWLVRPDAASVRTWSPEALSQELGLVSPVPTDERVRAIGGAVQTRLDGLARTVVDAPGGNGNNTLNWAAGVAGALLAGAPDDEQERAKAALVESYLDRPTHHTTREGRATVDSGWKHGLAHPEMAADRSKPTDSEDERYQRALDDRLLYHRADREARQMLDSIPGDEPTGWEPKRITTLPEPPVPSICEYALGQCLMTPGYVHLVYGASESAKSWLAYIAAVQQVEKGNLVLIIDYEMGGSLAAGRLRGLGLSDEQIDAGVVYVSPEMSLSARDIERLVEHIEGLHRPLTLAVLDSLGESTTMDGLSDNDNNDMAAWFRATTRWLVRDWPSCAVVVIDHLPKDKTDSLFPIGSQRKRAFPFALLSVRNVVPFSRTQPGHSVVSVRKSRDGRLTSGAQIARIDGGPEGVRLGPGSVEDVKAARGMRLQFGIAKYLQENPGATFRQIKTNVTGKTEAVRAEVKTMCSGGLLSMEKVGNAHCYSVNGDVIEIRE